MESTLPRSTMTPSTTSERAPMKQSSSMITGPAWIRSSTPAMATAAHQMTVFALRAPPGAASLASAAWAFTPCDPRRHRLDRVAHFPLGRGADRLALFPGAVDRLRELAVVHGVVPLANHRFAQGFAPAAHAR